MDRTRTTALMLAAALALTTLFAPAAAFAVDVRGPEVGEVYASDLARAYAQCTAPNTVTLDGKPACMPAVTSPCKHVRGDLTLDAFVDATPGGRAHFVKASTPAYCTDGDYAFETALRHTGDYTAAGLEAPCPSGLCTWPDRVTRFEMSTSSNILTLTGGDADVRKGNFELMGSTILAPDGLPYIAPGIGEHPLALRFVTNLTVPIEPCTTGPLCDLASWTSPCDFETGEIEITRGFANVAEAHVTLRNVAGITPLCSTGTYLLEATVRGTAFGCGAEKDLCTLPDTTVTVPLEMNGRDLDDSGLLRFASQQNRYETTQILGLRVIDPTGLPIATAGLGGVEPLRAPVVKVKSDALRLRTTIPIPGNDFRIDPAAEPGLGVTVSDRDGLVYAVTVPEVRWQLQPPLGSRWTYADKGGVLNGLRKARVKRLVKQGVTTGFEVDLQVKGVDLSAADHASLTVNVTAPFFIDSLGVSNVLEWQGTRTCRGTYPKLTCK